MTSTHTLELLHREHLGWQKELLFYQDEIHIFQNKLLQIILNHLQEVNMEKISRYRQEFGQNLLLIADFIHQIKNHEKQLAQDARYQKNGTDHTFFRQEIEEFKQAFGELRQNFKRFLAKSKGLVKEKILRRKR